MNLTLMEKSTFLCAYVTYVAKSLYSPIIFTITRFFRLPSNSP
jgi:hypothetical protein